VKFSIYNALIYVPFYGRVMSAHAAGAVFEVGTLLLRKKPWFIPRLLWRSDL
jgi:hypothetical protein